MQTFRVIFYPDNKKVEVEKDKTILSAAMSAGIYLNSACGGEGLCGRCKVIVKSGRCLVQSTGLLSAEERKHGIHLACTSEVQSDLEVEIPAESRLNLKQDIYSTPEDIEPSALTQAQTVVSSLTQKLYLELPPPNLDDKVSDLERLERSILKKTGLTATSGGLANLKGLAQLLRDSAWKVTVTLCKKNEASEIILIEAGDTTGRNFGFVFDIGTTTLSGQLVDLTCGKVLGTKATYNKQAAFGSDVITRIIYANDSDGLDQLHRAVADDINEIIRELTNEQGIDLNDVTAISCAGNTTMIHLLLRIDPSYIRREPYVPTVNFLPLIRSTEAEIKINPRGILACVPGVASYLGGDVTAGVVACGLSETDSLAVLIDIGTNGEVVLGDREFLIACAASAGPAFEGSGISCGMRASRGAIQKVKINPRDLSPSYNTIGDTRPLGICGSGYIDILAEMLKVGILDKDGRIKSAAHQRLRQTDAGREFVVVFKDDTASGSDIVVSEADIDNLKRAKAAIYAASSTLIKHLGMKIDNVRKFFIAGGFGTYLDMDNAVRIGLLPDIEKTRFVFVGNSSLAGTRRIILSEEARRKADEIARKMTYLELSAEPGYLEEYIAALFFPHTDLKLFPNALAR